MAEVRRSQQVPEVVMRPSPSSLLRLVVSLCFASLVFASINLQAQRDSVPAQVARIVQAVDDANLTTLRGNTHPLALARFDRGAAPASMPLERMLLVLKRSPEQDAALISLLDQQQDKSSANYHNWLKPEEFGKRFGPADADIQAVTAWLQTHGFQIAQVSKGRTVIEFSGTAAMLQEAFHTQMHRYLVNGDPHWANATDPQIPSALAPVVAGLWSLHDFFKKPTLVMSEERFPLVHAAGSPQPHATNSSGHHFLSPGDFSLIYGINPVYLAGINGAGKTIAVVGRTDFNPGDVMDFRSIVGLNPTAPNFVWDGPDPGNLGGGEEAEAILDATWSGSLAPGANVQFVISSSTDTTDGVDLSAIYIVDNDLGDVMTESFGICEQHVTSSELVGFSSLAQQAAAQGITYIVSTGDTGSSGCDNQSETVATGPLGVNALASTPFTVAVGGTIFNENGKDSTYWRTSGLVSALKYIPEKAWNESCASSTCGNNANIYAGGGGSSTVVPKPAWQTGASLHIPNDGFRDLPDVSFSAAGHDPYLFCYEGSCSQQGILLGISGTSASAPSFAGIVALLDQKVGGRVGLANYLLYRLAAGQSLYPGQCNGSSTTASPNAACIFNDITSGNNAVPGPNPATQYTAGAGYDLATGLGSVNVNNLLNAWTAATFNSTQTTLTLNPLIITHGTKVNVDIGVTATSGMPTGTVSLLANAGAPPRNGLGIDHFTLNGGQAISTTQLLPGGTNLVTAHYAGDSTFAASDSTAVSVTVNPEASNTTVRVLTADTTGQLIPFTNGPYGTFAYLSADVAGKSGFGTPTGMVNFLDNASFLATSSLNSKGNGNTPNGIFNLSPGAHLVTATYSGDSSFNQSTSAAVSFNVTKAATTTAVHTNGTKFASGSSVILTAIVDTTSNGIAPSGSVVFFSNNTQLPGTAFLTPRINGTTGFAQGTTALDATLPDGTDSITAQYLADTNYTASTSSAVSVTVAPDFSLAFTDAAGPVMTIAAPGGSGNLTLAVTGTPGYNGTVSFTGCTHLPLSTSCTFTPTSVTGSGSTKLTFTTTASHSASNKMRPSVWAATGGFTLAGIFVLGFAPRKRRWAPVVLLLTVAWVLSSVGCGGSNSGGGGGGTLGTPSGTYIVTANGTDANFSHPVTFTVVVQ
jgi:hypothetical protein